MVTFWSFSAVMIEYPRGSPPSWLVQRILRRQTPRSHRRPYRNPLPLQNLGQEFVARTSLWIRATCYITSPDDVCIVRRVRVGRKSIVPDSVTFRS